MIVIKKILDKKRSRIIQCAVCALAIIFTLAFIFSNSAANSEESHSQSNKVVELLRPIIDPWGRMTEDEISSLVRKTAHFVEFAALGTELAVLCFFISERAKARDAVYSAAFSLLVADIDEFIQIYSGRGSSVADVFIDFSGAITGIAFGFAVAHLCRYIKQKLALKREGRSEQPT